MPDRYVTLLALVSAGCGAAEAEPCTVRDQGESVVISCPDGTEATVENGTDGTNGADGRDGANGTNATLAPLHEWSCPSQYLVLTDTLISGGTMRYSSYGARVMQFGTVLSVYCGTSVLYTPTSGNGYIDSDTATDWWPASATQVTCFASGLTHRMNLTTDSMTLESSQASAGPYACSQPY